MDVDFFVRCLGGVIRNLPNDVQDPNIRAIISAERTHLAYLLRTAPAKLAIGNLLRNLSMLTEEEKKPE